VYADTQLAFSAAAPIASKQAKLYHVDGFDV